MRKVIHLILWTALIAGSSLPASTAFSFQTDQTCGECHLEVPALSPPECQTCHFAPIPTETRNLNPIKSGKTQRVANLSGSTSTQDMILIPAGPFIMGYDRRHPDEGPSHTVDLPAFLMDRYEVTNAQYAEFVKATKRTPPPHWINRQYPAEKAKHPVVMVDWYDARDYCQWAGKRLPTEQEWEKAARGTDGRIFPWGDTFDLSKSNSPQRWKSLGQRGDTLPVGSFPSGKSPYGLYDVAGNVWEWTESWYLPHPGNTHITENYGQKYKVAKGGSWKDCTFYRCGLSGPTFNRGFFDPKTKNNSFGFRCAKDAESKAKNRPP